MRKAINTWYMKAGRPGSEHSWGVFSTEELPAALKGWGVPASDAAAVAAEAEKAAPAGGKGILRHAALVVYADNGDPLTVVRHY